MTIIGIWIVGGALLAVIGSLLTTLWSIIVEMFEEFYSYWKSDILPRIAALAQEAWIRLDRVEAPLKRAAKKAWRELRRYLVQQTLDVFQISPNHWAYKIISWFMPSETNLNVTRTEEQVNVPWENLPAEVRAEILRRQQIQQVDVTKTRDEEMELVS